MSPRSLEAGGCSRRRVRGALVLGFAIVLGMLVPVLIPLPMGGAQIADPTSPTARFADSSGSATGRSPVPSNAVQSSAGSYNVSFVPLGLPSTTEWTVTLGSSLIGSAIGGPISFSLSNGSYAYKVDAVPGYAPSLATGVVLVHGAGWILNVSYVPDSSPSSVTTSPTVSVGELFEPVVRSWLLLSFLALDAVLVVLLVDRHLLHRRTRR